MVYFCLESKWPWVSNRLVLSDSGWSEKYLLFSWRTILWLCPLTCGHSISSIAMKDQQGHSHIHLDSWVWTIYERTPVYHTMILNSSKMESKLMLIICEFGLLGALNPTMYQLMKKRLISRSFWRWNSQKSNLHDQRSWGFLRNFPRLSRHISRTKLKVSSVVGQMCQDKRCLNHLYFESNSLTTFYLFEHSGNEWSLWCKMTRKSNPLLIFILRARQRRARVFLVISKNPFEWHFFATR
jgi:hypothetical protein